MPALSSELQILQRQVRTGMLAGVPFEEVEEELINASRLPWQAKAALWLYGWSFVDQAEQRAHAEVHLALLDAA